MHLLSICARQAEKPVKPHLRVRVMLICRQFALSFSQAIPACAGDALNDWSLRGGQRP